MQNDPFRARSAPTTQSGGTAQNGYARASYASGGGGASRMLRIAGDVAAGLRGCASGAGTGEQQREAVTVLP
jgi:hypothetical protein